MAGSSSSSSCSIGKQLPKFALARWVEEESLSAVPTNSVRPGQEVYPGGFGDFKWKTKYYEAEVLALSGE